MEQKKGPILHWGWIVLASGFTTLFVTFSIRIGAYSVLLPEMIRDFQMTKAQAGLIKSAFSLVYLVFAPLMGWLTDRVGGRKVISFFCLFLGGGTLLMGRADNLSSAILFYSIVGIGAAASWVPIATLTQIWFGEKKRGLALGIVSSSYAVGAGIMGLILPVIATHYHWRMGWTVLGVAGLLLVVLNGFLLRDRPEEMKLAPWGEDASGVEKRSSSHRRVSYLEILKERRLWIIGVAYGAIAYGTYTLVDFVVTYGTLELRIPYGVASLSLTVISFSGVVGGIVLMALSDRIGRRRSLIITQVLTCFSLFFILWAGDRVVWLMVGVGWFGFLYGAVYPMYAACTRDYFPREIMGTVFGLLAIFYGVSAMVSPVLTGYLADVTGTFRWPFALGAVVSLGAALLTGYLGETSEAELLTHSRASR